jgi:uncharacterized protein YjgD (DUF1641 family)
MQLVDSKQKMLTVGKIIEIDAQSAAEQQPVEMAKAAFAKIAASPQARTLRYGNTLFIAFFSAKNPAIAKFAVANADILQNIPVNTMQFFDDMKSYGAMKIAGAISSPDVAAAFSQLSQKYDIRQGSNEKGSTTFVVNLGAQQRPGLALGE